MELNGKGVTIPNDIPDLDGMSNPELKAYARENFSTISKVTSREQLISAMKAQLAKQAAPVGPPERVTKAPAALNPCLPMALAAKAQLEAVGWLVKGKAGSQVDNPECGHDYWAEITASRGAETLNMRWLDTELVAQEYAMEHLKPSDNDAIGNRPNRQMDFDPDELTDSELVRMIRGMPVTWWNTLASAADHATIGGTVTIEHIFFSSGDEDNSKRIIKFVDRDAGGFRAFHVSALLKVG